MADCRTRRNAKVHWVGRMLSSLKTMLISNKAASFALLVLFAALMWATPALSFWKMGLENSRYVLVLLGANVLFALPTLSPELRIRWGAGLGLGSLLLLQFPGWSFVLCLMPFISLEVMRRAAAIWLRAAYVLLFLALLYWLRFKPGPDLITLFLVSSWLKVISIAVTPKQLLPSGLDGHLRTAFYFFAPPFLLGPFPLEWIRFAYFDARALKADFDHRRALRMMGHGLLFILLAVYPAAYLSTWLATSFSVYSEGAPWWQQAFWGYSLFLSRYFLLGGLTALAVGIFQLANIQVKYDFHLPFLSRDLLDFWSRYHSYGKDFLYTHFYLPIYFGLPRLVPHLARVLLSLMAVFGMVALVQHLNYVPAQFASAENFYSARASMQHATASLFLLIWTYLFRKALIAKAGRFLRLAEALCWVHTQFAIGYFFFGGYWNLWKGLPLSTYFLRIFF